MTVRIENGDCLELMKSLPDKSIDLFICDLPYGETNCKWDIKIDMEQFWREFKRLRKSKRTACIHFCSTKFGYSLIKSWEKGYKMDMVWKKRNKTGGLQSRHRPMRNHEMVYFFYEQAPKYNRDKYHKRIQAKVETLNNVEGNITNAGHPDGASHFDKSKFFEPPNPTSVIEKPKTIKSKDRKAMGESSGIYAKENQTASSFDPPNPASVLEETNYMGKTHKQVLDSRSENGKKHLHTFEPPNPASVVEETTYGITKEKCLESRKNGFGNNGFEPPNPASVVEEHDYTYGTAAWHKAKGNTQGTNNFEPPNPASILEEPEPVSMFESTKVFIGKRHHQTEKPQDILEFFLKYWTDEGQTILDPTMGSGSTGVACKKMKRNFIGFETSPKIFEVAKKRLDE
jgi:DNA modification methylase